MSGWTSRTRATAVARWSATDQDAALPPDIETLMARLNTDGAAWRHDMPDHARLVERIRAIPFTASQQIAQESSAISRKGDRLMPVDANRPPYDDPSFIDWIPEPEPPRPSRPWVRAVGLVAAVVVVALLAVVFAQIALQRGGIAGPATVPTATHSAPVATGTPAATPATTVVPTPTAKGYVVQVYFSKQPDSYNDPNAVFPVSRCLANIWRGDQRHRAAHRRSDGEREGAGLLHRVERGADRRLELW